MNFLRRLFCKHDWELILEYKNSAHTSKIYRCKKCEGWLYRCY